MQQKTRVTIGVSLGLVVGLTGLLDRAKSPPLALVEVGAPPAASEAPSQATLQTPATAPVTAELPPLTVIEERAAIAQVKVEWRAHDGETAEQILSRASKVARLVLRGSWEAYRDGPDVVDVGIGFVRDKAQPNEEVLSIHWTLAKDGSITLGGTAFRSIDLGWKAFTAEMIQTDFDHNQTSAERRFLTDAKNLDYVQTDM